MNVAVECVCVWVCVCVCVCLIGSVYSGDLPSVGFSWTKYVSNTHLATDILLVYASLQNTKERFTKQSIYISDPVPDFAAASSELIVSFSFSSFAISPSSSRTVSCVERQQVGISRAFLRGQQKVKTRRAHLRGTLPQLQKTYRWLHRFLETSTCKSTEESHLRRML